jgi:hypothetical protein
MIANKPAHTHSTSRDPDTGRIRVECGGEAFETGLTYRFYHKFEITQSGTPVFLKYTIDGDAILTLSDLSITKGDVEYTVWAGSQATEDSAFTNDLTVYQTNSMSSNPNAGRVSYVSVQAGGSATFTGEPNDLTEVVTASGGNKESVLAPDSSDRGFPAGIAYVRIARLDDVNSQLAGILKQEWTDRP